MRRAAGGEEGEITAQHPGLAVEALLMQVARAQGVPEPEVYYVLQPQDNIGAGFIMQWLEGRPLAQESSKPLSLMGCDLSWRTCSRHAGKDPQH